MDWTAQEGLSEKYKSEFKIFWEKCAKMNDQICNDRMDINKLAEKIDKMSDEEFEEYLKKVKEKE